MRSLPNHSSPCLLSLMPHWPAVAAVGASLSRYTPCPSCSSAQRRSLWCSSCAMQRKAVRCRCCLQQAHAPPLTGRTAATAAGGIDVCAEYGDEVQLHETDPDRDFTPRLHVKVPAHFDSTLLKVSARPCLPLTTESFPCPLLLPSTRQWLMANAVCVAANHCCCVQLFDAMVLRQGCGADVSAEKAETACWARLVTLLPFSVDVLKRHVTVRSLSEPTGESMCVHRNNPYSTSIVLFPARRCGNDDCSGQRRNGWTSAWSACAALQQLLSSAWAALGRTSLPACGRMRPSVPLCGRRMRRPRLWCWRVRG